MKTLAEFGYHCLVSRRFDRVANIVPVVGITMALFIAGSAIWRFVITL